MPHSKWFRRGIEVARTVAKWSKDRSTQVGAVVMLDDGTPLTFAYNGFARGVNDDLDERHDRPAKYMWTSHAEENAIANMARIGSPARGATLYVTHFPCSGCARKIIQSGLSRVVVDKASMNEDFLERWQQEMTVSKEMFEEAGVELVIFDF